MANVTGFIKENIGIIGAGAGGLALGGTVGYLAGRSSSKRKSSKRKSKSKSSRKRVHKYRGHRYTSHRRIHTTKTGQPYIILASGKARFISKKSARVRRKRKGGTY